MEVPPPTRKVAASCQDQILFHVYKTLFGDALQTLIFFPAEVPALKITEV